MIPVGRKSGSGRLVFKARRKALPLMSKLFKFVGIWGVAGCCLLLLGNLLTAGWNQVQSEGPGQACIGCHVSTYNAGLEEKYGHAPFWNLRCPACHLPENSRWSGEASEVRETKITGRAVTQKSLWRKEKIYKASPKAKREHLASLPDLEMHRDYRFRLAVSTKPVQAEGSVYKSMWLGLRPDEVESLGQKAGILLDAVPRIESPSWIKDPVLFRDRHTLYVSWLTDQPFYGWIEVQPLEGIGLEKRDGKKDAGWNQPIVQDGRHPVLRPPERRAINACYACHPESTLGTSHPVRLYGGEGVRIPDDLPTVDGMLTCVTCHDPHGSAGKKLVREQIITKLCVACHYTFKNSSPSTMFD